MSLTVKEGASAMSVTGGTDLLLSNDGQNVANGVHLGDLTEIDFRLRRNLTLKNRNPARQSDGTFSKGKRTASFVTPKELASGEIVYNVIRLEIEAHPETTAAERLELRMQAGQLPTDAELTNFWDVGSIEI